MLSTFIKNKGISSTIIHNNNKNYYNEMEWDADYDGKKANISLDINDNGSKGHIEMKMNNDEIAEILNIPSVDKTLDKRLHSDFLTRTPKHIEEDRIIQIYIKPKPILHNNYHVVKDSYEKHKKKVRFHNERNYNDELVESMEEILNPLSSAQKYTHISSPTSQEQLLFPLNVANKRSRRHYHKNPKSHITYKIHRKHMSSPLKSSKNRSGRKHSHSYSRRTF
jgi:hypothetical protein